MVHWPDRGALVMKTLPQRVNLGLWLIVAALLGHGSVHGAELPARLKALDQNGDGKLTAVEFIDQAMFAKVDTNKDGFVTAEEVRVYLIRNPPTPQKAGAGAGAAPQRSPQEVFGFLDRDVDSTLSLSEFEPLKDVIPYFRANPATVEAVFRRLDNNRDGGLSLTEFRGLYALGGTPVPEPPAPKAEGVASSENPRVVASDTPPTAEAIAFFEKHIRPVLADKCYKCHSESAEKVKGGLVLDTREGTRQGGDGGPAIVPGNLTKSLLIEAVRYKNDDLQMPPEKEGGRLPGSVIANFEKWVQMGAPDPRDGPGKLAVKAVDVEKGRAFWAFQPVREHPVPEVKRADWARSDIDRHLLAAMEAKGVKPIGDADRHALIRRVSFDLVGLPPTPDEVNAFVADQSPTAFAALVDRLLASPQFGERWGRHWLDVARYADSTGRGSNILYPEAWRYRDYVIASFNADKPYDEFVREQIAGDLLPAKDDQPRIERIVATGFLALGPKELAEKDRLQFQLDVVDEQLDTLGKAMLGLTLGCARCHDHKFDPIPQRDYYALAGVFRSSETCYGTVPVVTNAHPASLVELPSGAPRVVTPGVTAEKLRADQTRLDRELRALTGGSGLETYQLPPEADKLRTFVQVRSHLVIVNAKLKELGADGSPRPFAMAVREKTNAADMPLYYRGEPSKPAAPVPRGYLQVLPAGAPITAGSGRREFAEWIASPENPLTARVMVNRVWHHLFGRGLVPSMDNFGVMGDRPSHPALLDDLARRFVQSGWSVKRLIREMVLSRAYQQATTFDAANHVIDPDNVLGWRMVPRRLDAEAARDAMLAVSGRLDLKPPFASAAARIGNNFVNPAVNYANAEAASGMRSVYLTIIRDQVNEILGAFDFADPNAVVGAREETITPAQSLYLLNSPVIQSFADAWAKRLAAGPGEPGEKMRQAYLQAFGRPPTEAEGRATKEFFERFVRDAGTDEAKRRQLGAAAFAAFCQALLASAEFRTLN